MASRRVLINDGELEALRWARDTAQASTMLDKSIKAHAKRLENLLAKIDKVQAKLQANREAGPLRFNPDDVDALGRQHAPRKFASLTAPGTRVRVIGLLRQHQVTREQWESAMRWLAKQTWLGSTTALDVLNNWATWGAKALADAAKPTGGPALLEDD